VNELAYRVAINPTVVLYAQSGAGKTSLINARLIPVLQEKGFEVLPVARVRGHIAKIPLDRIENVYVFNAVISLTSESGDFQHFSGLSLADCLGRPARRTDDEGQPAGRVLILDQLEELFTLYPERWEDRRDFFQQVSQALEIDPDLRILFALREDFLGELDPYAGLLPGKLRTQFRLERLRSGPALDAVRLPLKGSGWSFESEVAETLVDNLLRLKVEGDTGRLMIKQEFVDLVQLQVVCQTLWENCQSLPPSAAKVITLEYLQEFGDVDQALSTFYENAISRATEAGGVREGALRRWFEQVLITPAGTLGTAYQDRDQTAGIPNSAVEQLVSQHIIRGEIRGGARWYELTHDRLISPIKASNERWLRAHSGAEQTPLRLERLAEVWVGRGRREEDLLDEVELLEAKRWLESPSADDIGYSLTLFSLVQASSVRREVQVSRSRKRLNTFIAMLVLLVMCLTLFLFGQRQLIKRLQKQIEQYNIKQP
jgi:hypothetical protein